MMLKNLSTSMLIISFFLGTLLTAIVAARKEKGPADPAAFFLPEDHPSVLADIAKWALKTHTVPHDNL